MAGSTFWWLLAGQNRNAPRCAPGRTNGRSLRRWIALRLRSHRLGIVLALADFRKRSHCMPEPQPARTRPQLGALSTASAQPTSLGQAPVPRFSPHSARPHSARASRSARLRTSESFLTSPALSPSLRDHSAEGFAAQSGLRTQNRLPYPAILQKCLGIAFSCTAWILFLAGLAHFVIAALHNQAGELGLGLDSTVGGAKYCLASFALAGIGLPQWVRGNRRLAAAVRR